MEPRATGSLPSRRGETGTGAPSSLKPALGRKTLNMHSILLQKKHRCPQRWVNLMENVGWTGPVMARSLNLPIAEPFCCMLNLTHSNPLWAPGAYLRREKRKRGLSTCYTVLGTSTL